MADNRRGWRQFQNLKNFDSKNFSKRVKKAEGTTTRHAHKFIVKRLDSIRNVRRQIVGWLIVVGCMVAAVGVQLVWFQQSYQTTTADNGGTYAEASLGPIGTLNPLYASSSSEITSSRLLFSSLYDYDKTGHLHGDLAENMQVDKSEQVYTITIRPNAKWHDGTSLTAKDVAFTVNLIKNPETRSPLRVNWQDVKVEALNDTTIQFTLPATYAAFPYALTFAVLPEHILGDVAPGVIRENTFSRAPVGSGPFSFRLLQTAGRDQKIVHMTAFEDYYGGTPKLSRFEVHAYASTDDIIAALRSGEVNAAADVPPTDINRIDEHNYDVMAKAVDSGVYALFNVDRPLLQDKTVRKALQLATDTSAIRRELTGNPPELDLPFINGQLHGNVPHAPAPNTAKAAAMLEKDGWKLQGATRQKKGQKLSLTITTTMDDQYEKVLEVLASQWRAVGVEVHTNVVDTSVPGSNFVQDVLQRRNYDVLVNELQIGADPDVFAYWHSSQIGATGRNFSNYSNKTADIALASARTRLEPELRNAKYITFAKQWLSDAPAIGLYQPVAVYAANKNVQSIDPSSSWVTPVDRFSNALYWTTREKSVYKTP